MKVLHRSFQKSIAIMSVVILGVVCLGFMSVLLVGRLSRNNPEQNPQPVITTARIIDRLNPTNRIEGLRELLKLADNNLSFNYSMIAGDGTLLFSATHTSTPKIWTELSKPRQALETTFIPSDEPGPPRVQLLRFPGPREEYLLAELNHRRPERHGGGHLPFLWVLGTLIVSVLIGTAIALFLFYRSLLDKAELADSVIARLQGGDLKARFPINKMDEWGQAMLRFNQMAEEIERLVERLHQVESTRMKLLQELAHDLRTPIASLKNVLETLYSPNERLTPEIQNELSSLALKEIEYFENLVEDLLFLAQVSEPHYRHQVATPVTLNDLLIEEGKSVSSKYAAIALKANLGSDHIFSGDELFLRRLFRNAFENAFSFARASVSVSLKSLPEEHALQILIEDDGPGLDDKSLQNFGERRISRVMVQEQQRVSVGLGSVIMKMVAESHQGSLKIQNRVDSSGKRIPGARLTILLPLTDSAESAA